MKKCLVISFLLTLFAGLAYAEPGEDVGDERCACVPNGYTWAISEGESSTQNNNGGCSVNPPAFKDIQCGTAINGYGRSTSTYKDQDWYRITLTQRDSVIWKVVARNDVVVKIIGPGPNGCSDRITYAEHRASECDTAVVSACLEPGVYWLYTCPEDCNISHRRYYAYVRCVPCTPPEPPTPEYDMGDLATCNYPTLVKNPAHKISGIAWLGDAITSEESPYPINQDPADDGVDFITRTWTPCFMQRLTVKITAGENYQAYADSGKHLYLNAWKDGNLDGDFCDTLCRGGAPEWIIQDEVVVPSSTPQLFEVLDPGREDTTHYDGIFRFRLTSRPIGPLGFGLLSPNSCSGMTCGTFDVDYLGEVEDYIEDDLQLAVEMGSFDAIAGNGSIALRWNTRSEQDNDRFEIERNGSLVARVNSLGNSPGGHAYQWVDENVTASTVYNYSLYAVDLGGIRNMLATASATPEVTSVTVTEYELLQNYPNPFNPTTSISFNLLENGTTILSVYNPMGQLVATLVNGQLNAGSHTVTFDAANLPSGLYLYRLESGSFSAVKKMLLMK